MVMEYEEYAAILKAGGQPAMQEYTKQFFLLVEGNLLPKYSICDIIEENFMLMPKETRGEFLYMMRTALSWWLRSFSSHATCVPSREITAGA